jgi:hypothetical protein
MTEAEVVMRCTRDGRVLWQHVAAQTGRSIPSLRQEFEGTVNLHLQAQTIPPPLPPISTEDREAQMLHVMEMAGEPVTVYRLIVSTLFSKDVVHRRLYAMRAAGKVVHLADRRRWALPQ